jgi:hypothetical protein
MRALLGILLVVIVACDSKATATDKAGGARAEQKSKEYESCGASMHCLDELRCFDGMCRRSARSTVGDYQAALGARLRTNGDFEAAIAAYAAALGHYDAEKLPLPPDVDCAYGATLIAGRAKKENAELGARVLHRCILAVPVGSSMRDQALAELALLADSGLDPLLLAASKTGDLYLTKGAARPASDKVSVAITANPPTTSKSWPLVVEKLSGPEGKPGLVACWEAYSAGAKKDTLVVNIGMKAAYVQGEYEDDPSYFASKLDPAAPGLAGPEAAADACVRKVIEPLVKAVKVSDAYSTKATITIK